MLIRFTHSGHYPDDIREVTAEEFTRVKALSEKYGILNDMPEGAEREFVDDILDRAPQKGIPTFLYYV